MSSIEVTHNWKTEQWDWPLQNNDGIVKVHSDDKHWEVGLEAQYFTPNEIEVKVNGDHLVVHCQHESRSDDHGQVSREVSRSYKLPDDVDTSSIKSHLTPKGILLINKEEMSTIEVNHDWKDEHWSWPLEKTGIVNVHSDGNGWGVDLEAQYFTPKEIQVRVLADHLEVNLKHGSRDDKHGQISREIQRSYKLPENTNVSTIQSHMDSDGILHITAQKKITA